MQEPLRGWVRGRRCFGRVFRHLPRRKAFFRLASALYPGWGRIRQRERRILPRRGEREEVVERMRVLVALRQWEHAKNLLERGERRGVIVHGMVDGAPGNERRDDDGRHAHTQLREIEGKAAVFR